MSRALWAPVTAVFARIRMATQHVSAEGTMPSLEGATAWLNSPPLSPQDLRGKVVVVQFWTYTCIDWLPTLPYISGWAGRYALHGLVVIGVHAPEHSFEYDIENVRRAVNGLGIHYPIAIDNHYVIATAFKNPYSPALYLVDSKRRIRRHEYGEGRYEDLENVIQELLIEAGAKDISARPVREQGAPR